MDAHMAFLARTGPRNGEVGRAGRTHRRKAGGEVGSHPHGNEGACGARMLHAHNTHDGEVESARDSGCVGCIHVGDRVFHSHPPGDILRGVRENGSDRGRGIDGLPQFESGQHEMLSDTI